MVRKSVRKLVILGGGQLAKQIASAAHTLAIACVVVDKDPTCCARKVLGNGDEFVQCDFTDPKVLQRYANSNFVWTIDWENVPAEFLAFAEENGAYVNMRADFLRTASDRWLEKMYFQKLEIPTNGFLNIELNSALRDAMACWHKIVIKTRKEGYDGKGQVTVSELADLNDALDNLAKGGQLPPLLAEEFVEYDSEVSVVGTRDIHDRIEIYPIFENIQQRGMLRVSRMLIKSPLADQANEYLTRIFRDSGYIGTLALEMFNVDGELWANEMAPRVHNSAHMTDHGASSSQFRQHVLAVIGRSVEPVRIKGFPAMVNIIGENPPYIRRHNAVFSHLYGKAPCPGRKIGHITVIGSTPTEREGLLRTLQFQGVYVAGMQPAPSAVAG